MGDGQLAWSTAERPGALVVAPAGRVDESTATAFADGLTDGVTAAQAAGRGRMVIDLGGIDYMSSRGLRGLTLAQRKAGEHGVTITLARPNPTMREILSISRYDLVFEVFDAVEDAAAS